MLTLGWVLSFFLFFLDGGVFFFSANSSKRADSVDDAPILALSAAALPSTTSVGKMDVSGWTDDDVSGWTGDVSGWTDDDDVSISTDDVSGWTDDNSDSDMPPSVLAAGDFKVSMLTSLTGRRTRPVDAR
jgi:hypothetical protein